MNQRMLIRLGFTALNSVMGFYLTCFVYRLITHTLMFVSFITGTVLYYLGLKVLTTLCVSLAGVMSSLRDNNAVMLMVAAIAVLLIASTARRQPPRTSNRRVVLSSLLALVFTVTIVTDWAYGVTPLNDLPLMSNVHLFSAPKTKLKLTVDDVAYLKNNLSGHFAEVEGILDYTQSMRRFILHSPETPGSYITAYFHRGVRTSLVESLDPERNPRYFNQVQPFIGKSIKVVGKCLNGAIYVGRCIIVL